MKSKDYKPGHRQLREKTQKPAGTSWWTEVGRSGFTSEAEKRAPEMQQATKVPGGRVDAIRDTWTAGPSRRQTS